MKPYALSIEGPKMLILDCHVSHIAAAVRFKIAGTDTELEVIPEGCTAHLQPMDVGLNKLFKDCICHEVEHFLTIQLVGTKPG